MKQYQDKGWLHEKYYEEGLCVSEIAEECGVCITTISRWAARFEIREIAPYSGDKKGPNNPFWKGGRYRDNNSGYVWVYKPEHPCCNKKGYVLEHRLIMEKVLGRQLRGNEIVHRRNGIKDDNRVGNLELIVVGEPNCGEVKCPFCNKKFKMG